MGLVELFVLLAAVSGSSWIVGTVAWLWFRTKRLEEAALSHGNIPKALLTEIEELKDALSAGDQELRQMSERLDFLERLLHSGGVADSGDRQLPSGLGSEGSNRGES